MILSLSSLFSFLSSLFSAFVSRRAPAVLVVEPAKQRAVHGLFPPAGAAGIRGRKGGVAAGEVAEEGEGIIRCPLTGEPGGPGTLM